MTHDEIINAVVAQTMPVTNENITRALKASGFRVLAPELRYSRPGISVSNYLQCVRVLVDIDDSSERDQLLSDIYTALARTYGLRVERPGDNARSLYVNKGAHK